MAEYEGIQVIVYQAAIQVVTAVMMVLRDTDAGPWPSATASLRESKRQIHSGLAIEKPSFSWNVQGKYTELLVFEIEDTNILETDAYELTDEEKVPVIKNWLGRESL